MSIIFTVERKFEMLIRLELCFTSKIIFNQLFFFSYRCLSGSRGEFALRYLRSRERTYDTIEQTSQALIFKNEEMSIPASYLDVEFNEVEELPVQKYSAEKELFRRSPGKL